MSKASEIAASMGNIGEELNKEASVLDDTLTKGEDVKKPFKMSDYLKPQMIDEEIDKEASAKKETTSKGKANAGVATAGAGAMLAKHTYDRGNLTGRETLYHNTRSENVEGIKKDGLKGKMAVDKKKTSFSDTLSHIPEKELEGKVYFGRKKMVADNVGVQAQLQDTLKGIKSKRETLKAKVPTWKMKEVDNPELLGAKNGDEFIDKLISAKKRQAKAYNRPTAGIDALKNDRMAKAQLKGGYKLLDRKGTAVIQGDVSGKYFKGHKGYQKTTAKEVGEFIKKNPKRFAKGVGQLGAGAALVGAGGKLVHDAYKQRKAEKIKKVANTLLEECGLEKIANYTSNVNDVAMCLLEECGL